MDRRVKVLPPEIVNKIAAGEVIERPASVLKELMENSLDAGAKRIAVKALGGGVRLLEVCDDGEGMEPEDALEALKPHATSKIRTIEDLFHTTTFGFRGEALSSILSVSRMELITRPSHRDEATRIMAQAGKVLEVTPWGAPAGTVVRVESLFYNVPARLKFLKSEATEASQIRETFRRIAIVNPGVSFAFSYEGRRPVNYPSRDRWWDRVKDVLDEGIIDHLYEVRGEDELCVIEGFLSHPNCHRSSATELWLYVNKRPVQDRTMLATIIRAYGQLLPKGRYPVGVINVQIRAGDLDVNVHPAKKEVRFRDPGRVQELLVRAVGSFLRELTWSLGGIGQSREVKEPVLGEYLGGEQRRPLHLDLGLGPPQVVHSLTHGDGSLQYQSSVQKHGPEGGLRYLGQVGEVYLVFAKSDGLLIVDQHACHERILFEELKASWEGREVAGQGMLGSEVLHLDASQEERLERVRPTLKRLGWSIDPFGAGSWRITSVPPWMALKSAKEFLQELISEDEFHGNLCPDELLSKLACKAAVKRGRQVTPQEALELLHLISKTGYKGLCPHGRPTVIEISISELQKRFGRS